MNMTKYLRNLMIIAASLNVSMVSADNTHQTDEFLTENNVVKLGVTDLSFHRATGAVVANILERMGFTVIRSFDPHKDNFAHLRSGEIDMIASAWLPSSHGVYKKSVEELTPTRELGLHYEPYALWGVPDYIPESEVSTISDLLKPAVKEKMTPTIQGIGAGAGITRFSIRMMDEYTLTDAGYKFKTGTQEQCVAAFEDAVAEKRWIIVPLWHPQFLHSRYKIRELTDPKNLLGGKDRAVLLARQDSLDRLFSADEIKQLDSIKLSNKIVAELDYAINRENKTEDEAAEAWLNANNKRMSWIINNHYSLPKPKIMTIDASLSDHKMEEMKVAAQNYAAFWDTGQIRYAKKALATDFIDLNLPKGRKQGPQGPIDASNWFRSVVPDLRSEIEEMIIVDNKVILRLRFSGHFTGQLGEMDGKGQAISFSAVDMYTIVDGKIKTNWHLEDNETLMKQLNQ